MTTDRITETTAARATTSEVLLDGLFTGMIGALAVAVWFFVIDMIKGRPLYTPSLLGNLLLHGSGAAAQPIAIAPLEIAAYTAFHFLAFITVGLVFAYLMTLFERFPIMFFVLLVLALSLQVGFFFFDVVLGAQLMGRLQAWTVVVGNVLAALGMALYMWKRHPSVIGKIENLWKD